MKKLFLIIILSFSLIFTNGCSKDETIDANGGKNQESKKISKDDNTIEEEEDKGEIEMVDKDIRSIIYEDDLYNFTLKLPSSWENNYRVKKEIWIDEVSDSIYFDFVTEDVSSNIFTIIVMDESILASDWDDPFLIYITEKDGNTFSYLSAMEPSEVLFEEENRQELEIMISMVEEVPKIIDSFEFQK